MGPGTQVPGSNRNIIPSYYTKEPLQEGLINAPPHPFFFFLQSMLTISKRGILRGKF